MERGGPDLYRGWILKGGDKPSKGGDRTDSLSPVSPPPEKETLGGGQKEMFPEMCKDKHTDTYVLYWYQQSDSC